MDAMQIDSESQPASQVPAQLTEQELDEKYPNRPHNHSETLPFRDLFLSLFNPLNDNKKKPSGPAQNRRRLGPNASNSRSPHEIRRSIIETFISRWRQKVGDDIYPAFRLILPEKDGERAMYGLKEKVLGRLLVKIMKIDKNSEDGFNLLNWKLPGTSAASRMAGDFAGRCFEVISKRPMRTKPGNMTIAEVNDLLDKLSAAPREENQLPVLERFYLNMNAEELMWLIRIILRQMKIGASEKTIFEQWHPDAEALFNVSSSLRRVCWELHNPSIRLEGENRGITLMQCFQPQLAQFQMHSFQRMVDRMRPTEDDPAFWIEEKLDGERMQMHMLSDESVEGGKRFAFWSRKAKDYTYLYGNGFHDKNGSLTRHLVNAFDEHVDNIILDGEMITWDAEQNAMAPFGTLKTAALSEQRNPFSGGLRPLYKVFDILYLNDQQLTRYTLRDRRNALERAMKPVPGRFELHGYQLGTKVDDIEPVLRKVIEESTEGLVLKNPRSPYRLNDRNDDWMKVKPEYMSEFGESLDCIIVGGYFGSGYRGGQLSSFLCGLRVDTFDGNEPGTMKQYSFCKVGGGFTAGDYANIRHHTDGKWKDWDPKKPPIDIIELAGEGRQIERPDKWIRPDESVVVEVKAAQIAASDDFRLGLTLRFPRFKRLRSDKDWKSALSVHEFLDLKNNVERQQRENRDKQLRVENRRQPRASRRKKTLVVAGYDLNQGGQYSGPTGTLFKGLNVFVVTDMVKPQKTSKPDLEKLLQGHGAKIVQTQNAAENTICVADRRTVKVASIEKAGNHDIIRPTWILDCIAQQRADSIRGLPDIILPWEPKRHLFYTTPDIAEDIADNVDRYGDSFARDVQADELKEIFRDCLTRSIPHIPRNEHTTLQELVIRSMPDEITPAWLFRGLKMYFNFADVEMSNDEFGDADSHLNANEYGQVDLRLASITARLTGATLAGCLSPADLTHIVVSNNSDVASLRREIAGRPRLPRIVTYHWIEESWKERTMLDEERFIV